MDDALTYSRDKVAATNMISVMDKEEDPSYDQIQLPTDIIWPEVIKKDPTISENELVNMIMKEVDNMDANYFDKDINPALSAIEELENRVIDNPIDEPNSTLKVCSNQSDVESRTGHKLVESYLSDIMLSEDETVMEYVKWLLPSSKQIDIMKRFQSDDIDKDKAKQNGVFGNYQYKIPRHTSDNLLINKTIEHLTKGKKIKNEKSKPETISPDRFMDIFSSMEDTVLHYGSISDKPAFLNESWDCATQLEADNSEEIRQIYNYVKRTNGAQLCHSLSNFYQRLCHLKTSLSTKDNIYVPPNGSFIAIIPNDHAPVTSANCDLPMIFITRTKKKESCHNEILSINEFNHKIETDDYVYLISKLCRLNVSKMANWDQAGYRLVANASYICSLNQDVSINRVVGILTLMMLDVHQKTSELLDLLKYVAFMPFSDLTRLSSLIKDKFDILMKTKLDVWTLITLKNLIFELSMVEKLNASKPKLQLHNGTAIHESFRMHLELPSIFDLNKRHTTPDKYIEEIAMIYTVRGKLLYGSQFMDKSIQQTAQWEEDYQNEKNKYGNWVTDGEGAGDYPFDSKFAFSSSAIIHAIACFNRIVPVSKGKAMRELTKGTYNDFLHYNCSLRGCVKEPEDRAKPSDIHTTSMESCL